MFSLPQPIMMCALHRGTRVVGLCDLQFLGLVHITFLPSFPVSTTQKKLPDSQLS